MDWSTATSASGPTISTVLQLLWRKTNGHPVKHPVKFRPRHRPRRRPSLTIKRRINAAPAKVYAAWTDPEKLAAWFGPSKVKEGSLKAETDPRIGGRYRISFTGMDGEYSQVGGIYRDIVPNELLVFSWARHSTPESESLVRFVQAGRRRNAADLPP